MNWQDFLQTARVRAIEESDGSSRMWDAATLREAARLTSDNPAPTERSVHERSRFLSSRTIDRESWAAMSIPAIPWMAAVAGWAVVAFIGFAFSAIGQEREINILSLSLITIIVWNLVVYVLSILHGLGKRDTGKAPRWLLAWHDHRLAKDGSSPDRQPLRFREIIWPVALRRAGFLFRARLHVAAALFALSACVSMYARGWSQDYQAVWESTLLSENGVRGFFGALFTPASAITGVAIPFDDLSAMHRTASAAAAKPGPALPWMHLYAATLGIFVIAPRLLLAILEHQRAKRSITQALRDDDWRDYAARLRETGDGSGAPLQVLAFGLMIDDAARDRWAKLARQRWRDLGPLSCEAVPVGKEGDFANAWSPEASRVLVVFNLSATPETEVHREFAQRILAGMSQNKSTAACAFALDDFDLKKRWSTFADASDRLAARVSSWRETFRGLDVEWI